MIRKLFILGFAACLTGISRCDKGFGFKSPAYDDLDADDEYQESLRMLYKDIDSLDVNEDQAELNRNVGVESNTPESTSGETKTPVINKAEEANDELSVRTDAMNLTMGSKTTNTKKTTINGVNSDPSSENGTYMKVPKKRLVTIQYYVYNSDDEDVVVQENLPKFQPNRDVFFMLPGFMESEEPSYGQLQYVQDFFKSISSGILSYCNCSVIGVKWSFEPPSGIKPFIQYRASIITGRRLGKTINAMKGINKWNASLTLIGHDLGNLAVASLAHVLKRPPDYIYGLDQRVLCGNYRDFYLRQDLGRVVETLTTNGMNYNYGHRNFYPNGGNFSNAFGPNGECFFCYSYQLLSDDMTSSNQDHYSTFCSSYNDYLNNYCDNFPQVSYFNRYPADQLPVGNYFITEIMSQRQAPWE